MVYCNLHKLMKEQAVSLEYMAEKIHIPKERLEALYNNSAKDIHFEELGKLCAFFDTNPGEFFTLHKPLQRPYTFEELKEQLTPIFSADPQINEVFVFGSYARNEATIYSDVDIYMYTTENEVYGYFEKMTLKREIEKVLHIDVDLIIHYDEINQNTDLIRTINSEKKLIYRKSETI